MITLTRCQMKLLKPEAVDITVKTCAPQFKPFAPTWEMVMTLKDRIKETGDKPYDSSLWYEHGLYYTEQYLAMLENVEHDAWLALWNRQVNKTIITTCYCRDDWFCHTGLLAMYMASSWPELFVDKASAPVLQVYKQLVYCRAYEHKTRRHSKALAMELKQKLESRNNK